jgi:3-hydroxybutyryl-CoA dehydratase
MDTPSGASFHERNWSQTMNRPAGVMTATPYDEFELGSTLADSTTIDVADIDAAAALFGDYNPIHVDQEVAEKSVYGQRILHGPCVSGLMMATVGNAIAGTGIGELDLSIQFKGATLPGDTLNWTWTVTEKIDKPKYEGGIVAMEGVCKNQDDATIVTAATKVLVSNRIAGE